MSATAARIAATAALMFLAACGAVETGYGQYRQLLTQNFSAMFGTHRVTLQQAAAIPYASMGWRLNDGPQNIIILATDAAQEQLWTSRARIVIQTQDGRIKRTFGLPRNMGALTPRSDRKLNAPATALQGPYTGQFLSDFPDMDAYSVPITCRAQAKGRRAVTILGRSISTVRVEEQCTCPSLRWTFKNIYWIDSQTGFVWRSRQTIHPLGDTLETEMFRV